MAARRTLKTTWTTLAVACAMVACEVAAAQCEYEVIILDGGPNCWGNPASASPWAISNTGIVVGEYYCVGASTACWWTTNPPGGPYIFNLPPGAAHTRAIDVNDHGQAAVIATFPDIGRVAVVTDGDEYTVLETLPGGTFIEPNAIDNAGTVVGTGGMAQLVIRLLEPRSSGRVTTLSIFPRSSGSARASRKTSIDMATSPGGWASRGQINTAFSFGKVR